MQFDGFLSVGPERNLKKKRPTRRIYRRTTRRTNTRRGYKICGTVSNKRGAIKREILEISSIRISRGGSDTEDPRPGSPFTVFNISKKGSRAIKRKDMEVASYLLIECVAGVAKQVGVLTEHRNGQMLLRVFRWSEIANGSRNFRLFPFKRDMPRISCALKPTTDAAARPTALAYRVRRRCPRSCPASEIRQNERRLFLMPTSRSPIKRI